MSSIVLATMLSVSMLGAPAYGEPTFEEGGGVTLEQEKTPAVEQPDDPKADAASDSTSDEAAIADTSSPKQEKDGTSFNESPVETQESPRASADDVDIQNTTGAYQVSSTTDFQKALADIEASDSTAATIEFTVDGIDVANFAGIEGKHITLTSSGSNLFTINKMGTNLVGDLVFDNVSCYDSKSEIYANGHLFETTKQFSNSVSKVYGGGTTDVVSGTDVVLRGGTFTYTYGGGREAGVAGDTHVLIDGASVWMLAGGGYGSSEGAGNVDGSTYVQILSGMLGGRDWYTNAYIYAGGYNNTKANPETIAVVGGDTHLTFGGDGAIDGNIGYFIGSRNFYAGSYFSTVKGDTYLSLGEGSQIHNADPGTTGGYYPNVYGAGQGDIVEGCVHISVSGGENGQFTDAERTRQAGIKVYMGGNYTNSKSNTIVQNKNKEASAMTFSMSGGSLAEVYAQRNESIMSNAVYSGVEGDVTVAISGGMVARVIGSHGISEMEEKNPTSHSDVTLSGGTVRSMTGHRSVTLQDYGAQASPAVMQTIDHVHQLNLNRSYLKIGFKNWTPSSTGKTEPMKFVKELNLTGSGLYTDDSAVAYIASYTLTGSMYRPAEGGLVTMTDSEWIADNLIGIYGDMSLHNSSLTLKTNRIENQQLGFPYTNRVHGDFSAKDAKLYVNVVDPTVDGGNYTNKADDHSGGVIRLQVEGAASGNCDVYTIEQNGYPALSNPTIGDNYIVAKSGVASTFNLANEEAVEQGYGFVQKDGYVKYPSGGSAIAKINGKMWQVAKSYTVTFDKNGGDTEADPGKIALELQGDQDTPTVGTLPQPPTRTGFEFIGWNTAQDGSGISFTDLTPVTGNITVYAQWKGQETLWYRDVYLQSSDGSFFKWKHGQGGWALPSSQVTIGAGDFDGTSTDWGETLGVEYVFDSANPNNRLSDTVGNASKSNPLRIYYKYKPHTVTYEYEGSVPEGAPNVPGQIETWYSAEVPVAAAPQLEGWVFSGWTTTTENATIENGTLIVPNADVVLKGSWTRTATPGEPTTAEYKVEHYQEQLNGTYKLTDTEFPLYGAIGSSVTASPKSYEHYHVNKGVSELSGLVIKPVTENGEVKTLVLKVYYDRDTVNAAVDKDTASGNAGDSGTKVGEEAKPLPSSGDPLPIAIGVCITIFAAALTLLLVGFRKAWRR